MEITQIKRLEWKTYFDRLSKAVTNRPVSLEVAGLDVGDQLEGKWASLNGLSYDSKRDVLYVHFGNLDHPIIRPQEVAFFEDGMGVSTVSIRDIDGHIQVLKFQPSVPLEKSRSTTAEESSYQEPSSENTI